MDTNRWQQIQDILDKIFDLPPEQQEAIIEAHSVNDADLARELRSFLSADTIANDLFAKLNEPLDTDLTLTVMQSAKTFEEYDIIQKIGTGGMGVVYQVWDKRLERYIALKYLSPKLILNPSIRQQFKTEARAASRIDHPNICAIYDIGESTENQLYFTMPYYAGEDLAKHIANPHTRHLEMAHFALQIAAGLAAAHAEDILHRDIKPANIMITDKNIVKILDFGIAKVLDSEMIRSQPLAGSTAYMSPEQTLGHEIDQRSDIWSFGVVLYEMFTGQLPFTGKDNAAITQAILAGDIIPLTQRTRAPQSKALQRLVAHTLQTDPDQRCDTINALIPDLQRLQSELHEATHSAHTHSSPWLTSADLPATENFSGSSLRQAAHPRPHPQKKKQTEKHSPQQRTQNAAPPGVLAAIEKALLIQVGPVARVMMKRANRKTQSITALCHYLADRIEPESAREQFLDQIMPLWQPDLAQEHYPNTKGRTPKRYLNDEGKAKRRLKSRSAD